MLSEVRVSVRSLVEFVLRKGDLDSRFTGSSRAVEGTKAHQKVQKSYKESEVNYASEVSLKGEFEYKDFKFIVEGRADGIIVREDKIIIDEIKTLTKPLEELDEDYNPIHWAQAKCYAYIYAVNYERENIDVQLTYYNLNSESTKSFIKSFKLDELKEFFFYILSEYYFWANNMRVWQHARNVSIKSLKFPFKTYRKGQREMAVAIYNTIKEKKKIFIQAPTGIGKTISTIFPSIKAMGEGLTSKIFYLTAKTITRTAAVDALQLMDKCGLKIKAVILTAKDKICFKEKPSCNPEDCEFAKGHFDRLNNALSAILSKENIINRDIIEKYAEEFNICPFEFSLEIALWMDCIICDYNYVFDPRVYLKRFFDGNSEEYVFLIDEAHNLVDRGREMFSAEIFKKPFLNTKRFMKHKAPAIYKAADKVNSVMIKLKKEQIKLQKEEVKELQGPIRRFISECEEWLTKNQKEDGYDDLLELYFNAGNYIKILEFYDDRFVTYMEDSRDDFKIRLFCIDPSYLLSKLIERSNSAVFFSATMTPIGYFKEALGGENKDYMMRLQSPFSLDNRQILICDNISTKYKNREKNYLRLSEYIRAFIEGKVGNYMVFFPSYKYMEDVHQVFCDTYKDINVIKQQVNMEEDEKEKFLESFKINSKNTLLAFVVLGGIFSEGIDLKGNRLIGAVIVGVGLPQICSERDIIMNYFNDKNKKGYEYSYIYPGMNKVLQASGRVIRTEEDKGIMLLIDERFSTNTYKSLFPKEWFPNITVRTIESMKNNIISFWEK